MQKTYLEWRGGMMIPFSWKTLWKYGELFLEDKKIVLTLHSFFIVGSFFDVEGSTHNYMDSVARILGKEVEHACFTFKVDSLLDS